VDARVWMDRPRRLLRLIRYRFLVVAGLLPYLAGSAAARGMEGAGRWDLFLIGLLGIGCSLVAVEAFNEYFDSHTGNDTVFSRSRAEPLPRRIFWLACLALGLAGAAGLWLTHLRDARIMAFAGAGAVAVVFYVGPPLRLAYRGLGEFTIALCYGPLMLCGAYYLQAGHLTRAPLLLSAPAALFIFALVLVNELPDYYQDLLVDKRNLVVRLGRRRAANLYGAALALAYAAVVAGLLLRAIPPAAALFLPSGLWAWRMARTAARQAESPREIIPAIRGTILLFSGFLALSACTYLICAEAQPGGAGLGESGATPAVGHAVSIATIPQIARRVSLLAGR